ncbi:putative baseplate assembly protein [Pseudactinotalea sp. Z1748]|uniref:putative baseplate assembly protein n=1 Tax=Pseudactinotalea sp. Z1748 TaxID=3413027 RepID=UPI003C79F75D
MTCHDRGCDCDPLLAPEPTVWNAPAQDTLVWRAVPHSHAMARLLATLGGPAMAPPVRALAGNGTDDPAVALLDAFAMVADTVSFYTERIAQEGYLRTATERESVQMLARTIGYELRPGVAAATELAFGLEEAPGAPTATIVPANTPVQSIPIQDQLPQVFETSTDLEADVAWNAIPGATSEPATTLFGDRDLWLAGTSLGLQPGDVVLILGEERRRFGRTPDHSRAAALDRGDDERWEFRMIIEVHEPPDIPAGWTRVVLQRRVGWRSGTPLTPKEDVTVHTFGRRAALFGAQAPDPALLVRDGIAPHGVTQQNGTWEWDGIDDPRAPGKDGAAVRDVIEVDGDQARIVPGSWIVLERSDYTELYGVERAAPAGTTRFGTSGKVTQVRVDMRENLETFGRRRSVVHCEPRDLPGGLRPVLHPVPEEATPRLLRLEATDPPLPVGRRVMVTGFAPGTMPQDPIAARAVLPPLAETTVVAACEVHDRWMDVWFTDELTHRYDPASVRVRGNVAAATHGETIRDVVLGSGDARVQFQRMSPRRGPLTHLRAPTPSGTKSTLQISIDDVTWQEVETLDLTGPTERVYTARGQPDGTVTVTMGDGAHGARVPTGSENVRATFRVGVGSPGALNAGQLSVLPKRPYGIRDVINPAHTHSWADPEGLGEARTRAPLHTRTLERAVSVTDHQDLAASFAGIGLARADAVWDGRRNVVVVSVLDAGGQKAGEGLIGDLTASLLAAREVGSGLMVLSGDVVRFGVRVDIAVEHAHVRTDVEAAVRAALASAFAVPAVPFAVPVTASRVLVNIRSVPGVRACTLPLLSRVTSPIGAPAERSAGADVLGALPARWDKGPPAQIVPAQVAGLEPGGVRLGVMRL